MNPIILRINPDFEAGIETTAATKPYILVAGLNRVEAHRNLGLPEIPATVRSIDETSAEMLEIDENLARTDLSTLERAVQLKRRQELYNLKHGVSQGKTVTDEAGEKVPRFDQDAAAATGYIIAALPERQGAYLKERSWLSTPMLSTSTHA